LGKDSNVKPPPFSYIRAETLDDVFDRIEEHGDDAKILAGGQSLIPALNMRLSAPTVLVDICHLEELSGISADGDMVRIGATTPYRDLQNSPNVSGFLPLVSLALPHIAHPAIRNRGTIGGSLANADPAAELPACAVALGAEIVLANRNGRRKVAAADFFQGLFTTAIAADEILVSVEFKKTRPQCKSAFLELARRQGDYAMVGLAAHAELNDHVFQDLHLVFFGISDAPIQPLGAIEAAKGKSYSPETVQLIEEAVKDELDPQGDLQATSEMKTHLAGVLVRRALAELAGEEPAA